MDADSPLNAALRKFETVEANLGKAERLLNALQGAVPKGIAFVDHPEYDQNCRDFTDIYATLPKIDGWKPDVYVMGLDEIAQNRLDAQEVGEIESQVSVENQILAPARVLREYRHHFNKKRRELVREAVSGLADGVDSFLRQLAPLLDQPQTAHATVLADEFEKLKSTVAEIGMLLGSTIAKPPRWSDLNRHLAFGQYHDLHDIINHDWPAVGAALRVSMYGENEPLPVDIDDLGSLVSARPRGSVATRLKWEALTDESFERLLFALISTADGYQNPEWLMRTNAPDRGRDLSVYRVHEDPLGGTTRLRVIIQCKHWQTKSVSVPEIATLREQMRLWEPPRIDVCVIATSGRFTSDAVAAVERNNSSDTGLRIEMWPESHLERLLADRPSLIAQFAMR